MSGYYVPGTVLAAGGPGMSEADEKLSPYGYIFYLGEIANKQINKRTVCHTVILYEEK